MKMDKDSEETIFYFDSSALIRLHLFYGPDILHEIWEELETLFADSRIASHILVLKS